MRRAILAVVLTATALPAQALRENAGFKLNSVPRNDDGSSSLQALGFPINLFGKIRSAAFVNNNGNITFDSALSTFTPFGLRRTEREIIAPFFADVDTRPDGSKLVTYGPDVVNGHRAFGVNWVDVGYYSQHTDKLNSFQLVLIERADQGPGDFDIEFNYARISWETGDASGGVGGFGGTPAAAGWSNGADTSYELPGSLIPGAFLDNGPYALVRQSLTGAAVNTPSSQSRARAGRLTFRARDGIISPGLSISGGQFRDATAGVPYSEALTVRGADPPYRWTFQSDVIAPPGLTLNSSGVLVGTPTAPGTYSFTIGVTGVTEDGEITVFERGSITVRQAALRITSSCPLPDAFAGRPYSFTLASTGGTGGVWNARELPPGLGLTGPGVLAGTPQTAGTYFLDIEVRSADGSAVPARASCRLIVVPSAVNLTRGCILPRATMSVPFSQALQPAGGFAPYRFELLGDLPQGVALTPDGRIAGTPGFWGVWLFKIATTDDRGARGVEDCQLIVDPARFTTSVCPLPSAGTRQPYGAWLTNGLECAVVGKLPEGGALPAGLSLSVTGQVTGTPTAAGTFGFTLRLRDATQASTLQACQIAVIPAELRLDTACPLPDARVGESYSAALQASGGTPPYQFSFGPLPDGLAGSASGIISGRATQLGGRSFALTITDAAANTVQTSCSLGARPPVVPAITLVDPPPTLAPAVTNAALTVQLAATYSTPVRGQISLEVTPETRGTDPVANSADPLLGFANGQRTAAFTIPAGVTRVAIPLASTGTVASNVAVSLRNLEASGAPLDQFPTTKFLRVPALPPTISSVCYERTNAEDGVHLDFRVSGLSTTRSLDRAVLTIPGSGGPRPSIPVPAEFVFGGGDSLTVDASAVATAFFSSPASVRTGGAFTLVIPVDLADVAPTFRLDGVQINLFNPSGGSGAKPAGLCP